MTARILLVDDSPLVRMRYRLILEKEGFEVVQAADGQEALDALGSGHGVHLVVTDLHMPGMDGNDLVTLIRQSPPLALLPVLMLTGASDQERIIENLSAGASDYVVKGRDAREFMARVKNLARVGQLQEELVRVSTTDELTGAFCRRYGSTLLGEEEERRRSSGSCTAVGLVDIDHFKSFNDTLYCPSRNRTLHPAA